MPCSDTMRPFAKTNDIHSVGGGFLSSALFSKGRTLTFMTKDPTYPEFGVVSGLVRSIAFALEMISECTGGPYVVSQS